MERVQTGIQLCLLHRETAVLAGTLAAVWVPESGRIPPFNGSSGSHGSKCSSGSNGSLHWVLKLEPVRQKRAPHAPFAEENACQPGNQGKQLAKPGIEPRMDPDTERAERLLPFLLKEIEQAARENRVSQLRMNLPLGFSALQVLEALGYRPYGQGETGSLWWIHSIPSQLQSDVLSPETEAEQAWMQPMGQGIQSKPATLSGGERG